MHMVAMFLLIGVAAMSSAGELPGHPEDLLSLAGDPTEPRGLYKRYINCPPRAICEPITPPPIFRKERASGLGEEVEYFTMEEESAHRQKRGSKPVPIIACNRKTGKCRRI